MRAASRSLTILFCRTRDPISWAIRQLTWSQWSHVVILEPDGRTTIEARYPEVRESTLDQVLAENDVVLPVVFECADSAAAITWARTQVGHGYDTRALFGFIAHRDWTDEGKWFCSEFATMALAKGGSPRFQPADTSRITPQMLWMLPGQRLPLIQARRPVAPWPPFSVHAVEVDIASVAHAFSTPLHLKESPVQINWTHFKTILDSLLQKVEADAKECIDFASACAAEIEAIPGGAVVNDVVGVLKGIIGVCTPVAALVAPAASATAASALPLTAVQAVSLAVAAAAALPSAVAAVSSAVTATEDALKGSPAEPDAAPVQGWVPPAAPQA